MVDRQDNIIHFNLDDRREHSVQPQMIVPEAVGMAVGLLATVEQAGRNLAEIDRSDKAAVYDALSYNLQAGRVGRFATRILDLCPDEHLQYIAASCAEATE